jgi:hypothetical protein
MDRSNLTGPKVNEIHLAFLLTEPDATAGAAAVRDGSCHLQQQALNALKCLPAGLNLEAPSSHATLVS